MPMTYGLISDIHGNLEALEAVLKGLEGVDGFLCLGDLVGYGADPAPCLARVRSLAKLICVAGNHDRAAVGRYELGWFNDVARAAIEWTAKQLSAEEKSYLASLPMSAHADGALLAHGSAPDEMGYITTPQEARACFDAMPGTVTFVGHTHVTEYYALAADAGAPAPRMPDQVPLWSGGQIELDEELRYIINPGAVGQPRDGNPAASFGVWRVEEKVIEIRRVPYDVRGAQEKMGKAGLPEYLAQRLAAGR